MKKSGIFLGVCLVTSFVLLAYSKTASELIEKREAERIRISGKSMLHQDVSIAKRNKPARWNR